VQPYLPTPYPGELLFSILGRCAVHQGLTEDKPFLDRLYQDRHVVAVADIPSHIQALYNNTRQFWKISPEEIIRQHTLFPLYAYFVGPERCKSLISGMLGNSGIGLHTQTGMAASVVTPIRHFRYCPACIQEMKQKYGECYWYRSHQVAGLDICLIHNTRLQASTNLFRPTARHRYFSCRLQDCELTEVNTDNKQYVLAQTINSIFDVNCADVPTLWQWSCYYRDLARQLGLVKGSRVKHPDILSLFIQYWGVQRLSHYGLLPNCSGESWLTNIFRKHKKSFSYLQHSLVIRALSPHNNIADALMQACNFPKEKVLVRQAGPPPDKATNRARKQWLLLLHNHPEFGIKKIRELPGVGALYAWLYRHDANWLTTTNKHYQKAGDCSHTPDWSSRDKQLARQLLLIEKTYSHQIHSPRRTRNWYLKQLAHSSSVEHHMQQLPLCSQFFIRYVETLSEYQIRRITRVCIEAEKDNSVLSRWQIERQAGLSRRRLPAMTEQFLTWIEQQENEQSPFQKDP